MKEIFNHVLKLISNGILIVILILTIQLNFVAVE